MPLSCPGLCGLVVQGALSQKGSRAYRGAGSGGRASMAGVPPEWFPAAIVSALPGLLVGSLFRGLWRGVGQEEEGVQPSPKAPRNVSQEGEEKGGGTHPWETRTSRTPD